MANARAGLKTRNRGSASRQSSHVLRQGERYRHPKIVTIFTPSDNAFKAPKSSLSAEKRRSLQKQIQVYKSRQRKLDEGSSKWLKHEAKITEMREQLDRAGDDRRNTVHFFELELCLTDTPPTSPYAKDLPDWIREFIKKEFPDLTPTTGAVHLDQGALHGHVIIPVPDGTTWRQWTIDNYGGNRQFALAITERWHSFVASKGVELDELKHGVRYTNIQRLKEATGYKGEIGSGEVPPPAHLSRPATKPIDQIKVIARPTIDRDALKKAVESLGKTTPDQSLK